MKHPWIGKYIRPGTLPTPFCAGCGCGIVLNVFCRAVDKVYGSFEKFVFVSGIGCSAWIPSPHFYADTLHVLHGRAIPAAMGIKLSRPDLEVVVIGGDGDLLGIGMNHLIHAARRNMDLLVILVNNFTYAMTGGQLAPTTPLGAVTSTTPYGNPEPPFDICEILSRMDVNYVARWTVWHVFQLEKSLIEALEIKRGFRFIEVVSVCPTRWGRFVRKTAVELMRELRERSVPIERARGEQRRENVIVVGVFKRDNKPGFIERYEDLKRRALATWGKGR